MIKMADMTQYNENKVSSKNTSSSNKTSTSDTGSGNVSSGSTGTSTTTDGKTIIEDVTGNAVKTKKEKIVNKANKYKAYNIDTYNKDIKVDERRMTDDTPSFRIYVSYEKLGGNGVKTDKDASKVTEQQVEKEEEESET